MTPLKIHNGGSYALMEYLTCWKCVIFYAATASCYKFKEVEIYRRVIFSSLSSCKPWNSLQNLHSINVDITVQCVHLHQYNFSCLLEFKSSSFPVVALILTVTRNCSGFQLLSNKTTRKVLIVNNRNVRFWVWVIVITVRKVRRYATVIRGIHRACVLRRKLKTIRYVIDFVTWL